jgi:hypothetical protein
MDLQPLTVVCAWRAAVVQPGGERVSHGICVDCAAVFIAKLRADFASEHGLTATAERAVVVGAEES